MSVFIDGATLSSLLYSHVNSEGNQEGVLLGQVVRQVKEHISDSQINNTQLHTFTYVASHIPWPREDRVYTRGGIPILEKMAALLGDNHTAQEVVGWYSFRRNSTLRMSMKERTLHKHLEARFSPDQSQHFVFLMCVHSGCPQRATHTVDHFFATLTPRTGAVKKLSVSVTNLGDTVHTQYKTLSHSAATQASAVQTIVNNYRSQFVSGAGDMQEVQKVNNMSTALNSNLQRLCQQVSESEQEAGELEKEVAALREELERRAERGRIAEGGGGREGGERVEAWGVKKEGGDTAAFPTPTVEQLLSLAPTTTTSSLHHPTPDLSSTLPPPTTHSTKAAPSLSLLDNNHLQAPPPSSLQSVVDVITDMEEEEEDGGGESQLHTASGSGSGPHTTGQAEAAGSVQAKKGAGGSRTAGGAPSAVSQNTDTVSSGEDGTASQDHFSFVDNLLSSENRTSSGPGQGKKSTATVPRGATVTFSARSTRSQGKSPASVASVPAKGPASVTSVPAKGPASVTSAPAKGPAGVTSAPAKGPAGVASNAKDRAKTRNSPTRSTSAVSAQSKREGSPKSDGKGKTAAANIRGSGGSSTPGGERRRGRGEGGSGQDHRGGQNRDTSGGSRPAHSYTRQDSHSRAAKLDPASFALGSRGAKNRSKDVSSSGKDVSGKDVSGKGVSTKDVSTKDVSTKDVSTKDVSTKDVSSAKDVCGRVISQSDSEGEKMDGGPEDTTKNGTVDGMHERQDAPRSLSPVF